MYTFRRAAASPHFSSPGRGRSRTGGLRLGLVVDRGVGGVLLDRLDPLLHGAGGGVALAHAHRLAVGGLEDEEGFALLVLLALVAFVDRSVALHRFDAAERAALLGIELAGED